MKTGYFLSGLTSISHKIYIPRLAIYISHGADIYLLLLFLSRTLFPLIPFSSAAPTLPLSFILHQHP